MLFYKYNNFILSLFDREYGKEQAACEYFLHTVSLVVLPLICAVMASGALLFYAVVLSTLLGWVGFELTYVNNAYNYVFPEGFLKHGPSEVTVLGFIFSIGFFIGALLSFLVCTAVIEPIAEFISERIWTFARSFSEAGNTAVSPKRFYNTLKSKLCQPVVYKGE
ncbi:hypothetical protein [Neptuniibacter sp. QD37_11]|uniref:hypothetical protein n=1 Tax=Neptuniibacter sp. QD37_11 TaxID=3398209 RepID=UPI0039F50AA2